MRIGIFATAMELREYVRARDVHARVSPLHTYTRTHVEQRSWTSRHKLRARSVRTRREMHEKVKGYEDSPSWES